MIAASPSFERSGRNVPSERANDTEIHFRFWLSHWPKAGGPRSWITLPTSIVAAAGFNPRCRFTFAHLNRAVFRLKTFGLRVQTGIQSVYVPARGCESLERETDGETPPATVWATRERSILVPRGHKRSDRTTGVISRRQDTETPKGVLCLRSLPLSQRS